MRRFWRAMSMGLNVVCGIWLAVCIFLHIFTEYYSIALNGAIGKDSYFVHVGAFGTYLGFVPEESTISLLPGLDLQERMGGRDWWFFHKELSSAQWIFIPFWFLLLVLAIKPTWSFIAWRRHRKRLLTEQNLCPNCGYDLRGNPEAPACPECGAAVDA